MILKFKNLFFILIILFASKVISQNQNKIDSIKSALTLAVEDTNKIKLYLNLGRQYKLIMPDSTIYYYEKALKIALKIESKNFTIHCYSDLGEVLYDKGNYEKSIECFKNSLKIAEEVSDKSSIADNYSNIGIVKYLQGFYDEAIEYFQKSLKINEEIGNKSRMSQCYGNIGNLHFLQLSYDKSLEYYMKALNLFEELNNKNGMANVFGNIGNIYQTLKDYETAIKYYSKSLKLYEELKDNYGIANCYVNIGSAYKDTGNYNKALEYYQKSLKIDEELGDKFGISLVNVYISLLQIKLKKYNEAIDYAWKGLGIAKEIGVLLSQKDAYSNLSAAYDSLGNFKKAYEYHKLFKQLNDSIFNEESSKQVKQMEARYQNEKNQQEIELLNKDKELQKTEISKQRAVRNYLTGLIILILFVVGFFIRAYIQKQKTNKQLRFLNKEITEQKDLIEIKNQNLSEANRIIEHKNKNITDSIRYAKRIQSAIFPPQDLIDRLIPNSFILYKPKSIVSGDFYWLDQKDDNQHVYIAAVDCTGHGVPGAFMSLVGYNILNQALNEKQITKPSEILNFLSKTITKTLRQTDNDNSLRDGMDLVLCCIDKTNYTMEFAGAHNSLYLLRDNELIEFKTDKFQIGHPFSEKFIGFNNQKIELKKNDMLYLFSDGFMDQFNSANNLKYSSKRFKELLNSISIEPLKEQHTKLNVFFEEWKGNNEQTDDVTILGIKF